MKLGKHFIALGNIKARVHYSLDNRVDEKKNVTIYEKDYGNQLFKIFGDLAKNDSDCMIDYFETSKVVIFEENHLYSKIRAHAEKLKKDYDLKISLAA